MPELPEVETIRRGLLQHLLGQTLRAAAIRDSRLRRPVPVRALRQAVKGAQVIGIQRRAKYLLINLDRGQTVIMHLGMSGRVLLLERGMPIDKHDHVIIALTSGSELRFRDPRRFGLIDVCPTDHLTVYPPFRGLGPEPLAKESIAGTLYLRVAKSRKPIKNLLMDAGFLAGIGNIYANEALYRARVHPERLGADLSLAEWQGIFAAVRDVLMAAIEVGGTTLNDFMNTNGEAGYFQLSLAVYGREGEACGACGGRIRRTVLAGRGTFFCPVCQQ